MQLIGVYLRNFKCYQGIKYIPLFNAEGGNLVGFVGDNGVGKSAVLEALQIFFFDKV